MVPPPPQTMLGCCLNIYLHIWEISALPLSDIHQTDHKQPGRQKNRHADRQTDNRRQRKKIFLFFYQKVILNIWATPQKNFNIVWGGGGFLLTFSYIKKLHFCTQISKIPNYFAHYCSIMITSQYSWFVVNYLLDLLREKIVNREIVV